MADLAYTTLGGIVAGAPNTASDVTTAFTQAQTSINNVDAEQFTNTLAQYTGVNNGSNVGRGKFSLATEQSTTSGSYTYLTTPDQVTGIVLPTDGLLFVAYHATWKMPAGTSGLASIHLGTDALKTAVYSSAAPGAGQTAANFTGGAAGYSVVATQPSGLFAQTATATSYGGDVTTGQIVGAGRATAPVVSPTDETFVHGSVCGPIFAAAGTYTVGVKFLSDGVNPLYVKNRKLWVWTLGF